MLATGLDALSIYFALQPYLAEVTVVDGGSPDRAAELVRERTITWPALRLVSGARRAR